jgi:uncharacterized protein
MIIDCHTHLGRNDHIRATADELLRSMDKAGIEKSLVFAGELNDCPNEWMLEQIKPHKDRLYGVMAYEHNRFRYVDFEAMAKENNVVGIKFYTGYDHYYPVSLYENTGEMPVSCYYYNPLQICSDLKIPAIFHCGDCLNSVKCAKLKFAHPLNIDEPAVDYDDVKFVIAHMAFPWQKDAAEVCYKNDNVYSDISGFVYGKFSKMDRVKFKKVVNEFLEIADSKKLLFGTDWPISDQKSYRSVVDEEWGEVLNTVSLSKNVRKVFGL